MSSPKKEIFFHVGLGKTASKFLQHKIFPKLKGIYYIKPSRYGRFREIISGIDDSRVLVSREFDNQLETETEKFAAHSPQARIIIILRRHDSWMASQYRRHVKNGYSCTFEEFLDVEHDRGKWRRDKVFFLPKLMHLENLFGKKPLVLFHEDLAGNPRNFIHEIIRFTGASCNMEGLSLKPHHTSYSDKQLKVIRRVGKYFFPQEETPYSNNPLIRWVQKRSRLLACYAILYSALLVPDAFLANEALISDESLEKVRRFYAADWEQCRNYAGKSVQVH